MRRLAGQHALVTGGARGIGVGIAERLLDEGARMTLLDRDEDVSGTADTLMSRAGREVAHVLADVTDVDSVRDVFSRIDAVDVLVNNAGAWSLTPFADSEPEQWLRDINVNLFGVLNVTHAALPPMIRSGSGRIVSIVSDSARVGEPHVATYAAAKAGVMGFTRSLAKEVGRHGITVNCVSLSTTVTDAARATFTPDQLEKMTRRYPMGRLGEPADAAAAVAYFVSREAAWVTGQTLSVNGGYAML